MATNAHLAANPKTKLTADQLTVLRAIIKGNETEVDPADRLIDLDQLLDRTSHFCSKAAMQFKIRALVNNKMIEKAAPVRRRERWRVTYKPTLLGTAIGADRKPIVVTTIIEPEAGSLEALIEGIIS